MLRHAILVTLMIFDHQTGFSFHFRRCDAADRSMNRLMTANFAKLVANRDGDENPKLFIFGLGYVGTGVAIQAMKLLGWRVAGTSTSVDKVNELRNIGIQAYHFTDEEGPISEAECLNSLLSSCYILSTIPPTALSNGDPVLRQHGTDIRRAVLKGRTCWIGYLSSTGVYGDTGGAWVTESDSIRPDNAKAAKRADSEDEWMYLYHNLNVPTHIFRIAGIYGPGRSALETLRKAKGNLQQCDANDVNFVSRVHVVDVVNVLLASMLQPSPGVVMNVADDQPSTRYEVLSYGCRILGYPLQRPTPLPSISTGKRGTSSKRVDNTLMKRLLESSGKGLVFPDYRSGLSALILGNGEPFEASIAEELSVKGAESRESAQIVVLENGASDEGNDDESESEKPSGSAFL